MSTDRLLSLGIQTNNFMKKAIFKLFNTNGTLRWTVEVIEHKGEYYVQDTDKHSLFSNPLAIGTSIPDAIKEFLEVETKLIESL